MTQLKFPYVTIFLALCCITIQLICLDFTEGKVSAIFENSTDDVHPSRAGRSKRSIFETMPPVLTLHIYIPDGESIHLSWIKEKQYLANENSIIIPPIDYPTQNIMESIGEFIVYRDLGKCSAVVYYEKTRTLTGSIGLEYSVINLPYDFDGDGNYVGVTEPHLYVTKRTNQPPHNLPPLPTSFVEDLLPAVDQGADFNPDFGFEPQPGPSAKRQRTERDIDEQVYADVINMNISDVRNIRTRRTPPPFTPYFLEILIFITHDVAELAMKTFSPETYVEEIVKDFFVYFNAIDMIFQKLRTKNIQLHINIAKIVFEQNVELLNSISDGVMQFSETITKRREYLTTNQHLFTPDSFDYVFVCTNFPIKHESNIVSGMTHRIPNLYEVRKRNMWYSGVPITIMGYAVDYSLAVQKIGRTLSINMDSWEKGRKPEGQCSSIMQEDGPKCQSCLKWSDESKGEFKTFFDSNRNRCFLLNEPRSLLPLGRHSFSSPVKLCRCFGYRYYLTDSRGVRSLQYVRKQLCSSVLKCQSDIRDRTNLHDTLPPFDGTPCRSEGDKVCWNGKCQPIERCN